jgi:hypothetical protein
MAIGIQRASGKALVTNGYIGSSRNIHVLSTRELDHTRQPKNYNNVLNSSNIYSFNSQCSASNVQNAMDATGGLKPLFSCATADVERITEMAINVKFRALLLSDQLYTHQLKLCLSAVWLELSVVPGDTNSKL